MFRVELSCTGKVDSEVMILMQLNLTVNSSKNFTVLNFKRRKMCYKSKKFIYQSVCFMQMWECQKIDFVVCFTDFCNQILIMVANEKRKSTNRWNSKIIARQLVARNLIQAPLSLHLIISLSFIRITGYFILEMWNSTKVAECLKRNQVVLIETPEECSVNCVSLIKFYVMHYGSALGRRLGQMT